MSATRANRISTILLATLFGIASGMVGALVTETYVLPTFPGDGGTVIGRRAATEVGRFQAQVEAAQRSLVTVYVEKPAIAGGIVPYLPGEALAAGGVLTADGWLLTAGDFGSRKLVAVVNGRRYPVTESRRDVWSGITLLKIAADGLQPVAFATGEAPATGEAVALVSGVQLARPAMSLGLADIPAATLDAATRSAERMQRALLISTPAVPGSLALTGGGEVAAVVLKDGVAAPAGSFRQVLTGVIRDRSAARPLLGAEYLDLSAFPQPAGEAQQRGAQLTAVVRRSPAEAAGFRVGDVVTAVNGEEVGPRRPLSDIITDYRPDAEITVSYRRAGAAATAEVTLGTLQ